MNNPEFIRGNQKTYIRLISNDKELKSYEYQMCRYNKLDSLLNFQQRSQNGVEYLYYEVTGMQSLDIYLQTQKLRRSFAVILAKAILKLCREISEYALDITGIVFQPKYIMVCSDGKELKFLYSFSHSNRALDFEVFIESCIEHLDYEDELLMQKTYYLYEYLLEQEEKFSLETEMERFYDALTESKLEEVQEELDDTSKTILEFQKEEVILEESRPKNEKQNKELEKQKKGCLLLILFDFVAFFLWKPLTLLKIFFLFAIGMVLSVLYFSLCRKKKIQKEKEDSKKQEDIYIQEYETIRLQSDENDMHTQIVMPEESCNILYHLQEGEPKYISIEASQKMIGKDSEKVQICLAYEGISRIHALVYKEGTECIIEDLNSTNGTWINGKMLEPRKKYVFQQGDKVRFAGVEYIFR